MTRTVKRLLQEIEFERIAKRLMKEIQYCNGMVNRYSPEVYPQEHVDKIAAVANEFFRLHPQLYNDDDILNICDGCLDENQALYGHLQGYKELDEALNNYFENE